MMLPTFAHRVDIRWQRLEHSCHATWSAQRLTCLDTRSSEIWAWYAGSSFDRGPLSERSAPRFKRWLGATSPSSPSFARTRGETRLKPCSSMQGNWAPTPCSESAMTRRRSCKASRRSSLTEQRLSSNRTREQATREEREAQKAQKAQNSRISWAFCGSSFYERVMSHKPVDVPAIFPFDKTVAVAILLEFRSFEVWFATNKCYGVTKQHYLVTKPHEFVARPHDFVAKLHDFVAKPHDFVAKSHDFVAKPHDFVTKPHELVAKPHELVAKPHELVAKPHELVAKPHELVAKPHELVAKPHELAAKPHEFVAKPHELVTKRHSFLTKKLFFVAETLTNINR